MFLISRCNVLKKNIANIMFFVTFTKQFLFLIWEKIYSVWGLGNVKQLEANWHSSKMAATRKERREEKGESSQIMFSRAVWTTNLTCCITSGSVGIFCGLWLLTVSLELGWNCANRLPSWGIFFLVYLNRVKKHKQDKVSTGLLEWCIKTNCC